MKSRKYAIGIVMLVAASPVLLMALFLDDWSRDLTTNVATTDPAAADAQLHPLTTDRSVSDLQAAVRGFAEASPRWALASEPAPLPTDSPVRQAAGNRPLIELHLVRTTPLMGYQDDVWVAIESDGSESVVHAHSQSRVGKGDLGQNPRNLRELLKELAERLGS